MCGDENNEQLFHTCSDGFKIHKSYSSCAYEKVIETTCEKILDVLRIEEIREVFIFLRNMLIKFDLV